MQIYVKEALYVLDYLDNIVDTLFLSDDHVSPGYAYDIQITEANTGYSDLVFSVPNTIIEKDGSKVKNPKLKLLTPLVKLRYNRKIFYTGDKEITVNEPTGYGDTTVSVKKTYSNKYPDNVIEDYTMDYIVQPVDKKRNQLELDTRFTAIDYPRFSLSKKHYGLTINEDTEVRDDWSIYEKAPMSIPGVVQYVPWSNELSSAIGATDIPLEWDAAKATRFPMTKEEIGELLKHTEVWTYGMISTVFYWPISATGRFEGTLYNKGDYLTLQVYEKNVTQTVDVNTIYIDNENYVIVKYTWNGTEWVLCPSLTGQEELVVEGHIKDDNYKGLFSDYTTMNREVAHPSKGQWTAVKTKTQESLDFYGYEWLFLDQGRSYITPNNACNYLLYALQTTNWTIKNSADRYVGTYMSINDFPTVANENDYLIYKQVDKQDEFYVTTVSKPEELPTNLTKEDVGKWAFVTTNVGGKIVNSQKYSWDGLKWYIDWHDKEEIATYFYSYKNGHWVDVTAEAWTHSIDKKTGVLYDVDEVTAEVATPEGADSLFETTELRSSITVSDSNCYNLITEICKEFQLYPIYDCLNRTVSLKLFNGKNYGLTYRLGGNVDNTQITEDGDRVITKLRCYGGTDAQGKEKINLGEAERKYIQRLNGFYKTEADLPTGDNIKGYWAIVDPALDEEKYWISSDDRKVYYYDSTTKAWMLGTDNGDGTWTVLVNGEKFLVDAESGIEGEWSPNAPEYIQARSPYGTEYIYNFKWMYDNKWMSKEQILDLYRITQQIQDLNKSFLPSYSVDFTNTTDSYVNATVNYEATQDEYMAILNSMGNNYYYDPESPSAGTFNAFPEAPKGCFKKADGKNYVSISHCYNCGHTQPEAFTTCPVCYGKTNIERNDLYIPVFGDFVTGSTVDEPRMRGFYSTIKRKYGASVIEGTSLITPYTEKNFYNDEQILFVINGKEVYDTSSNLYNWNDCVRKWIETYGYSLDNLRAMNKLMKECEALDEAWNIYTEALEKLEDELQDKYGDYIVEGKYNDDTICYESILLAKSLDASAEASTPKITYNLNVIDSSGLIEYRKHCNEVYNDLVHTLHNTGQIVPRSGDYVTVYDEPMGLYGIPALITQITRRLDNPMENSVVLDTTYTDSDDLVGNIISATNTVLNNTDIYARTAMLKSDGTIEPSAITETLEQSSGENISIIGSKGSSLLDSTGLIVTNPNNAMRKMRYAGNGIYGTNDNGTTWQALVTQDGINANHISSGTIDTRKIQVTSGLHAKVILDNFGLSVKTNPSQPYSLPIKKTIYGEASIPDWSGTNLSAFIGVDTNNNGLLYVKGQIVADGNSKIGNWIVGNGNLFNTNQNIYLSPNGIDATVNGNKGKYTFYSNGNFGVTTNGNLYATGVNIGGHIEATEGKIGNWNISNGNLQGGNLTLNSAGSLSGPGWYINQNGEASFTKGSIGGWTINPANLSGGYISGGTVSGSSFVGGSITMSKRLQVNSADCPNGVYISSGVGYLVLKDGLSNHPWVSGLNVSAANGISFCTGSDWNNLGTKGVATITKGTDYLTIKSDKVQIANNKNSMVFDGNHIEGNSGARVYINKNIFLQAGSGGGCYIGDSTQNDEDHRIVVHKELGHLSPPSTLNTKENIRLKDTSDILSILSKIDLYDYKYKEGFYDGVESYGYIIDYLEKIPNINKYLAFDPVEQNGVLTKTIPVEKLIKFLLSATIELNKEINKLKKEKA